MEQKTTTLYVFPKFRRDLSRNVRTFLFVLPHIQFTIVQKLLPSFGVSFSADKMKMIKQKYKATLSWFYLHDNNKRQNKKETKTIKMYCLAQPHRLRCLRIVKICEISKNMPLFGILRCIVGFTFADFFLNIFSFIIR